MHNYTIHVNVYVCVCTGLANAIVIHHHLPNITWLGYQQHFVLLSSNVKPSFAETCLIDVLISRCLSCLLCYIPSDCVVCLDPSLILLDDVQSYPIHEATRNCDGNSWSLARPPWFIIHHQPISSTSFRWWDVVGCGGAVGLISPGHWLHRWQRWCDCTCHRSRALSDSAVDPPM